MLGFGPVTPSMRHGLLQRLRALAARRSRLALFGLALTVVLAQSLGMLHGQTHGQTHGQPYSRAHAESRDPAPGERAARVQRQAPHHAAAHSGPAVVSPLAALFGAHDDDGSDCRLYDQLLHADALPAVVMAELPRPPSVRGHPAHVGWHHSAQSAGYLARGPPRA